MKCYAVIDTNVLVSALLKWDSIPGQVVQQTYAHEIIPVFNDSILQEYEEVLSREKFHFPKETVEFLLSRLKAIGESMTTVESLVGNFPDPKDVVFFEVAMEKNKTDDAFLVTGNLKHFPKHPKVVTPAEMLRILKM
ncbi:MAG: putative toxin-antitoxin system toxin component, PIN family [Fibrobacter sp.]|nr:putative toxin-antitoxin system toxin component, PIN family [Fibrobacter sp.]MDY6368965.1 putative toxin-antitoxin system toxin component, PIN family [Fibrobacter sp.]